MKIRLDELLIKRGLVDSLELARALIGAGHVYVDENVADKPGSLYRIDCLVRLKEKKQYVSRGGHKLEKALAHFHLSASGLCCLDIGASTGGFTDCLLQHGARRVYAVDVAYGQIDWKLRQDDRVRVIERFNARNISIKQIPEPIQLAVIDASFISLTKLIPPLLNLPEEQKIIVALIKPQFELPRDKVSKGGVVRDHALHNQAIDKIIGFANGENLKITGVVQSPILGPKGNKEFMICLKADHDEK